jgi:predicted transcriptional regulator
VSTEKEIVAHGEKALEIAEALNATTLKILKLAKKEPLYISTIAKRLGTSEPYISQSVQTLQDLKLITINYERGERGIRKVVSSSIDKISLIISDEEIST